MPCHGDPSSFHALLSKIWLRSDVADIPGPIPSRDALRSNLEQIANFHTLKIPIMTWTHVTYADIEALLFIVLNGRQLSGRKSGESAPLGPTNLRSSLISALIGQCIQYLITTKRKIREEKCKNSSVYYPQMLDYQYFQYCTLVICKNVPDYTISQIPKNRNKTTLSP